MRRVADEVTERWKVTGPKWTARRPTTVPPSTWKQMENEFYRVSATHIEEIAKEEAQKGEEEIEEKQRPRRLG